MKKAGLITIAIILVAAGIIFYYQSQGRQQKPSADKGRGTLVKERVEWKKYYM